MSHRFTNHLIKENSPYLLQHAHNPVNWYPWGQEALQKAKEENKMILVSIGYAACHWCHVMEKESFEDEATAFLMNEHFINIKIDREERPDLDHIYMDAVQAIAGSGGWPLNVFLTPETKPFYGGTYFPPVKAFNRSSWTDVLESIIQAWNEKRDEIVTQANNLVAYLQQTNDFGQVKNTAVEIQSAELFTKEQCHTVFKNIMATADRQWGGFGKAPKFPQTFTIQYLLQYYHFTGNKESLDQATLSLDKMLQGGIYDHVGGGLARYSTDTEWLAPHFEKMLYDNALLVMVLCDAFQLTRNIVYEKAIRKTIAFVQEELMDKAAGFYAALDADSEGEEGKYYVWEKKEVETLLGADAAIFCAYFDITTQGNWEGKNILRVLTPVDEFASKNGLEKISFEERIEISLQKLKAERKKRVKPGLDDKHILSWNALMLNAVSKAAIVLEDDTYKDIAKKNFQFILSNFTKEGTGVGMYHTYKNGMAKYPAFLDDYAYLVAASISLYEVTFDTAYLDKAAEWCEYAVTHFKEEVSPFFFYTEKQQQDVIVRKKEIYDGATPSGNGIMAVNLLKLSIIFNKIDWQKQAADMLEALLPMITKYPGSFGVWGGFLLHQVVGINEISMIGEDFNILNKKIRLFFVPNKIIMGGEIERRDFPMLANKFREDKTLVYLCRNYSCEAPFVSAEDLIKAIRVNDRFFE